MADDPLNSPLPCPPKPIAGCEADWLAMSPEQRAAELARFQQFWMGRGTGASAAASGGPPIVQHSEPEAVDTDDRTRMDWNPAPTREQLASTKDWNRY